MLKTSKFALIVLWGGGHFWPRETIFPSPLSSDSILDEPGGGGFFHQNRTWMCLPDLENLTISIPIFCQISHPSVYHFRKKSTQFGSNWVLFYNNLPKIHPIYVIWAPSSLMKTPDRYTKFCEKVPQKAGTYTYTMSM